MPTVGFTLGPDHVRDLYKQCQLDDTEIKPNGDKVFRFTSHDGKNLNFSFLKMRARCGSIEGIFSGIREGLSELEELDQAGWPVNDAGYAQGTKWWSMHEENSAQLKALFWAAKQAQEESAKRASRKGSKEIQVSFLPQLAPVTA